MHLGNGAVTPGCALMGLSAAGIGVCAAGLMLRRTGLDRPRLLTAGVLGAAVFAVQAINVPILPFASAHLVGGVILAWVLGAPLGILTMTMVLLMQAVLLGDGGYMALGVNILNMAILPALLVIVARRWSPMASSSVAPQAIMAGLAGGLAVLGAAVFISLQVAWFRSSEQLVGWSAFAWQMISTHALIGLAEGMLTVAILAMLGRLTQEGALTPAKLLATGLIGLLGAVLVLPLASAMPDGYEAAVERSGMTHTIESLTGLNQSVASLQERVVAALPGTEWLMLVAGAVLTGACLMGLGRLMPRQSPWDHA